MKRKLLHDRHQGHISPGRRTNGCAADQQQVTFQDADTQTDGKEYIFIFGNLNLEYSNFQECRPSLQVILETQWFDAMKCVFTTFKKNVLFKQIKCLFWKMEQIYNFHSKSTILAQY